ncbi:transporter substrate-binding domain-containing protein [Actinacidiphila acididurans]|uniref:Transporter substrate-binding domain-containing protein n=1 Tax=Actinacidiphila acididurans TaxID=2784346 RepID=A0ABS2TL81_9ACTN|nr:transporter substrate-binding domain-containing protein [Actinacidiphila acididurans]MBM9504094.1 transporter substrate-binding domain-containing protein [Actinacidiphila acididurans]
MRSKFGIVIGAAMVMVLAAGCSSSSSSSGGSSASAGGSGGATATGSPVDVGAPLPDEVKSKGKLTVGVKCDYPPFGYIDESSKNAGFEIDIAHQLASYAFGDPNALTLTCVTGSNRVSFLTSKRIDLIEATMNYTQERAQTIDFSTPYFDSGVKLLVPKDSPITSFGQLAGKSVISISGATASLWLSQCMKDVKQSLFTETSQALTALNQKRGVAFAQDDTLLLDLAAKNSALKVVGDAKADSPWGMGVRKGDTQMLTWLNAALAHLQQADFFWTDFRKTVTDTSVQQQFAKYVPRPGSNLTYPSGSTLQC